MYVLTHNNQFWTGNRFSLHCGEALKLTKLAAERVAKYLSVRMAINVHIHPSERFSE